MRRHVLRIAGTFYFCQAYDSRIAVVKNGRFYTLQSVCEQRFQAFGKEYCQFETFNATCPVDQVILISEARYGRLQLGRCVTRDYGYIGCSANVLDLLDRSCSGRRTCRLGVPTLRDLVQPCPKDLTSYLDVTYRCVSVFNGSRCNWTATLDNWKPFVYIRVPARTRHSRTVAADKLITSSSQLSSISTSGRREFSASCPIYFKTGPGQRIAVTLYSFRSNHVIQEPEVVRPISGGADARTCDVGPVTVVEADGRRRTHGLCDPRQHREQLLLTTNTSHVALYFSVDDQHGPTTPPPPPSAPDISSHLFTNYIIKLEVTGCADLKPPANARVDRYDDSVVVRCNLSHETWYLTCKGSTWIGTITNCSEGVFPFNEEIVVTRRKQVPFGLLMAVIIGICIGIVFGLVMLFGVFLYRRMKSSRAAPKLNILLGPEETSVQDCAIDDHYAYRVSGAGSRLYNESGLTETVDSGRPLPGVHSRTMTSSRCRGPPQHNDTVVYSDCPGRLSCVEMRSCGCSLVSCPPPPPPPPVSGNVTLSRRSQDPPSGIYALRRSPGDAGAEQRLKPAVYWHASSSSDSPFQSVDIPRRATLVGDSHVISGESNDVTVGDVGRALDAVSKADRSPDLVLNGNHRDHDVTATTSCCASVPDDRRCNSSTPQQRFDHRQTLDGN